MVRLSNLIILAPCFYAHLSRRLGLLKRSDVSSALDAILAMQEAPFDKHTTKPLLPQFWRGRMGIGKQDQLELLRKFDSTETLSGESEGGADRVNAASGAGEVGGVVELKPHPSRQ